MEGIPQAETLIQTAIGFVLITTRLGVLLLTAPVLNSKTIPRSIRAAVVAALALFLHLAMPEHGQYRVETWMFVIAIFGEVVVGAAAGLACHLVFAAVETAGQLLGLPMGLGFAQAVDPLTQANTVVTSRFIGTMMGLFFFAVDGHHIILRLLTKSFIAIPPGTAIPTPDVSMSLLNNATLIFVGAVQLAAPILLVLLGVMAALGLLAKLAPKVNLFVLSFAISIALGIISLRAALPDMTAWMRNALTQIEPLAVETLLAF